MKRTIRTALVAAVLLVTAAGIGYWYTHSRSQAWTSFLRGSPHRGGQVFFNSGCIHCHAIAGTGGTRASDLAAAGGRHMSLGQLVGVMWNHAPEMWKAIQEEGMDFPRINQQEMTDLFAYLYFVRYLDEPGNADRGKALLTEKGCVRCHALGAVRGRAQADLKAWGAFDNPLLWIQRMWNHASGMQAAMKEKQLPWPTFQGDEMVDLLAYIRKASSVPRMHVDFLPADPEVGERLFSEKGCGRCHAVRGEGGGLAVDLGRVREFPRTLTQVAGLMWNHTPEMWQAMEAEHLERPVLSGKEMADLLAYLYAVRYFDEPGDPAAGRRVFADKRCPICHQLKGEGGSGGPNITRWQGRISPVAMAYIMWRHGPKMYGKMTEMDIDWPRFKENEMADLFSYLNLGK